MAYYLWTANYTREAMQAMLKNPQSREAAARQAVEAAGGKLVHAFMALGGSDIVILCEFPDDLGAAAVSIAVGAAGGVTNASTTRLFTMAEFTSAMKTASKVAGSYKPPQG
jgi:uncharacterized protein with GYD domain